MKDDDKHESPENTKKPYTPPRFDRLWGYIGDHANITVG